MPIQPNSSASHRSAPYAVPQMPSEHRRWPSTSSSSTLSDSRSKTVDHRRQYNQNAQYAPHGLKAPNVSQRSPTSAPTPRADTRFIFVAAPRYFAPPQPTIDLQMKCDHQSVPLVAHDARRMLREGQFLRAESFLWLAVEKYGRLVDPHLVELLLRSITNSKHLICLVNELQERGIFMRPAHYAVMLNLLTDRTKFADVLRVLQAMNSAGLKLDNQQAAKILDVVIGQAGLTRMPFLFGALRHLGALTTANLNQALLPVQCGIKQSKGVQLLLEEMLKHGDALAPETVTAHILAAARVKSQHQVDFWIKQARLFGVTLPLTGLQEAANEMMRQEMPKVAWQILSAAAGASAQLKDAAVVSIFEAALSNNDVSLAIKILLWCSQNKRRHLLPECNAHFARTFGAGEKYTAAPGAVHAPLPSNSSNMVNVTLNNCLQFLDAQDAAKVEELL